LVETTAQRIAEIRTTAEAQEGLSAFLEKRKASWVTPATERGKKKPTKKS
jgi:methylglutaconyl-CoA hydratase